MGLWHVVWPLVLWVPEGLRACAGLWQPVATDYNGLDAPIEEFGDIEAWRLEASMPGCSVGWLAGLAGWLGWLPAGLAGSAGADCQKSQTLDAPGGRRLYIHLSPPLAYRDRIVLIPNGPSLLISLLGTLYRCLAKRSRLTKAHKSTKAQLDASPPMV